jgi:hypothetical protein|tara:strand:+ start:215 stop:523 length:309 start_codon:yes stop_codon:yes gene_type:complete
MDKAKLQEIIDSIVRVEARKKSNGYKVVAITEDGTEFVVKKSGALRCTAHFSDSWINNNVWKTESNTDENGLYSAGDLVPYTQCAKKPTNVVRRSLKIEVAA